MKWEKINDCYARTECKRYQICICELADCIRYTAFAVTGDEMAPLQNLGSTTDKHEAIRLCEERNERQRK